MAPSRFFAFFFLLIFFFFIYYCFDCNNSSDSYKSEYAILKFGNHYQILIDPDVDSLLKDKVLEQLKINTNNTNPNVYKDLNVAPYIALSDPNTSILLLGRYLNSTEEINIETFHNKWEIYDIAYEPMVLIVDNENNINTLSKQDIISIYTGKINSWSKIGGTLPCIYYFGPQKGSSLYQFFIDNFLKNNTDAFYKACASDRQILWYFATNQFSCKECSIGLISASTLLNKKMIPKWIYNHSKYPQTMSDSQNQSDIDMDNMMQIPIKEVGISFEHKIFYPLSNENFCEVVEQYPLSRPILLFIRKGLDIQWSDTMNSKLKDSFPSYQQSGICIRLQTHP